MSLDAQGMNYYSITQTSRYPDELKSKNIFFNFILFLNFT